MKFKIEKIRDIIGTESLIPKEITDNLLEKALFDEIPKNTISATLEDFFIEKISQKYTPEQISEEIPNIVNSLEGKFKEIKHKNLELNWNNIFSKEDEKNLLTQLVEMAKKLGANENIIKKIKTIEFKMSDSIGASHAGESANVARLQILRKTLDYLKIFPEENFNKVIRTLTITTFAHEAGHVIDDKFNIFSNQIPMDKSFNMEENRSERFAEFWACLAGLDGVDIKIREQEKLIHVKKVQEMWKNIKEYNKKYPNIGIHQLFNLIPNNDSTNISNFVFARRILYGGNQPEQYSSPYLLEDLLKK